jgi:hypothetical protein
MKKQRVPLEKLQQHKEKLLRKIRVPVDGLPGSLSVSRLRCGKKECHCKDGQGHENWTLTYMADGKKRVKHIPQDLVNRVRQKVDQGKAFKQEVNDVFVANAELLVLLWKQKRRSE